MPILVGEEEIRFKGQLALVHLWLNSILVSLVRSNRSPVNVLQQGVNIYNSKDKLSIMSLERM